MARVDVSVVAMPGFDSWLREVRHDTHSDLSEREVALCACAWSASRAPEPATATAGRFGFLLHNLVGHPCMELARQLGMRKLAWKIHEATLPRKVRGRPTQLAVEAGEYFQRPA